MKAITGHPYEALFALALTTGLRTSEYLGLTWNDLDLDRGIVGISRTLEWRKDGWQFADTKRSGSRGVVKLQRFNTRRSASLCSFPSQDTGKGKENGAQ